MKTMNKLEETDLILVRAQKTYTHRHKYKSNNRMNPNLHAFARTKRTTNIQRHFFYNSHKNMNVTDTCHPIL